MTSSQGSPFEKERFIAELAVQRAVLVTQKVYDSINKDSLSKEDRTPVTVADFAAQALVIAALHHAFPSDPIIAEANADALRADSNLKEEVWRLVRETRLEDEESETLLSSPTTPDEMLDLIDLGASKKFTDGQGGRMWTIDPIDGTQTFIQGGQYCVVAALLLDGKEKVGVLGCPHIRFPTSLTPSSKIPVSDSEICGKGEGSLVVAIKSHGVFIRHLSYGKLLPNVHTIPFGKDEKAVSFDSGSAVEPLRIVENSRSSTPQYSRRHLAAESLMSPWPPQSIFSTQIKYVACALGAADVHLRIPESPLKRGYVWDHAGGALIFEETGGKVTDLAGRDLDFTKGAKLQGNWGICAAPKVVHGAVLEKIQQVLSQEKTYAELVNVG